MGPSLAHDFAIKLHVPTFGEDEIAAAVDVLRSTWVTSGQKVKTFEREFAASVGAKHAMMCNSGSSANLLAIAALCDPRNPVLKPGDEVIVSALSWATTVWPLVQHGLIPVIVDIDPRTLNADPAEIEKAIGPKTKAIMPVHVYGNPCEMQPIVAACARYGLVLIEDCCEALGAKYHGLPVSRFGKVGTFSFYFSHHMTTLEGGMVVTDDDALADLIRGQRAHGWVRDLENPERYTDQHPEIDPRFLFVGAGYNLRATELQAAMGSVQLPKLAGFVEARQATHAAYCEVLAPLRRRLTFQNETPGGYSTWFGFAITARVVDVRRMRRHLEADGIETRPIICGNIALQPAMKLYPHRVVGDLPWATNVMGYGFSIGCHQSVGPEAPGIVAASMARFFG